MPTCVTAPINRPARSLREVVLPLALPGLAATGIITFVYCWNEFLLVSTAPVALVVLAFQRRIVRGLTAGALKF